MLIASIAAGFLSGLCWLVGDILLVGFEVDEEAYGDFVRGSQIRNPHLSLLMLGGSVRRLRLGVLWAQFSIPLMLASLFGLFELTDKAVWSFAAVGLLGVGFALSPVAHAAFYYVGIISKAAYARSAGGACSEQDARLINEALLFLDITWRSAVGITALGWLLYSSVIWSGRTVLPAACGFATPAFGTAAVVFAVEKLRWGRPSLNGAALNVALSFFFGLLLVLLLFS